MSQSSFTASPANIEKKWHIVDAKGLVLGRMATEIAKVLRGKHKATYTPHADCGDPVIVINARDVGLTGRKRDEKRYYWHTGWPGGIKDRTARQLLEGDHPERVIRKAVQRMIPRGPLGRRQLEQLKIYDGTEHPHAGQSPQVLDIGSRNEKNLMERSAQ